MSSKQTPDAVANKAARALTVNRPPHDDYCGFALEVGELLYALSGKRDGLLILPAEYLAFGILEAKARREAELDDMMAAEDDSERQQARERRERLCELIRLVTVDGKPIDTRVLRSKPL